MQTVYVLYKDRLESGDAIWASSFHAFEQQPIDSCVPLFNEKAASVAIIRHGMDIQHNITEYLNPG